MNIVHFSITALAGGPYRLVSVLRRETEHNVRLIDLKRWGRYPHDLVFEESPEEAIEIVKAADVVHLHNYIDLRTQAFHPIDFQALRRSGKAILRQFRTAPATLAAKVGVSVDQIVGSDVPSIVIAQFHERYYPNALVVPNAVPSQQFEYACVDEPVEYDICYSPSGLANAWSSRWDTKGGPETIAMLRKLKKAAQVKCSVISGRPLSEVLEKKRRSRIVIDDLVTGSYHASGLEGLCLGKAVLCHLDDRTVKVLGELTGSETLPFINAKLEDAGDVLVDLTKDRTLTRSLGVAARCWIDAHWSERLIAERYCGVYRDILEDPNLIKRQESLVVDDMIQRYFAVTLPDLVYYGRGRRYSKNLSLGGKAARTANKWAASIRKLVPGIVPNAVRKLYLQTQECGKD